MGGRSCPLRAGRRCRPGVRPRGQARGPATDRIGDNRPGRNLENRPPAARRRRHGMGPRVEGSPPGPPADAVHVWSAALDQPPAVLQQLRATLAPDELKRADRYHFPRDRDAFTAARGFLRAILAHYLAADPTRLTFRYTHHGKPGLGGDFADLPLRFNLSHTQGLAVYALTQGREV